MVLTRPEKIELHPLGALAANALETSINPWWPGPTSDFEIASLASAQRERGGAKEVRLTVGGDDRLGEYLHRWPSSALAHGANYRFGRWWPVTCTRGSG